MTDHHFVWLELRTEKPQAVKDFYAALFDWKAQEAGPGASMIMLGERQVGTTILASEKGNGSDWMPFVSVPDIKAATKKAAKLGAKIVEDSVRTPHGLRTTLVDPSGSRLALLEVTH